MSFYKYKSVSDIHKLSYALEIIKGHRFYLPSRNELNDPLEGICDMKFGFAGCMYYYGTPILHPHYDVVLSKYHILSLTTKFNSVVMWSHYGSMFNGICIEVDDKKTLSNAKKVIYDDHITEASNYHSLEEIAEESLIHKAKEWKYEEEYRIIGKEQYLEVDPDEILCVYIGYAVPKEIVTCIKEVCRSHGVETKIAYINPYEYKVESATFEEYEELLHR